MKIIQIIGIIGKLKHLKRAGWVKNNIPDPESVAEHSFMVAVMALVLAEEIGVNQARAVKMALIHDIGEAEIGDIITAHGEKILIDRKIKVTPERKAFEKIFNLTDSDEYLQIFDEFEANQTAEARFVRQLDKLEMAIQAFEYEKLYKINLEPFYINSRPVILHKYLRKIFEDIYDLRKDNKLV